MRVLDAAFRAVSRAADRLHPERDLWMRDQAAGFSVRFPVAANCNPLIRLATLSRPGGMTTLARRCPGASGILFCYTLESNHTHAVSALAPVLPARRELYFYGAQVP
jgi:hypothetical protein